MTWIVIVEDDSEVGVDLAFLLGIGDAVVGASEAVFLFRLAIFLVYVVEVE